MAATDMDQDAPYAGSFGREIRESLFFLDRDTAFTNHGSFGTVPRPVLDAHMELLRQVESQPDAWFRRTLKPLYLNACDAAAKFIGATKEEVVLVENATSAVNIIVRGLKLSPRGGILATTFTYDACQKAVEVACKDAGAEAHFMEIKLPIASEESIVQQYIDYLDQHPNVTFALVDHITSPSAVVMPVKEIVRVCHQRGVVVMVDGAHSPGQLPLDMKDIGADYYTGNFHKWVFCPRGCAALYVRDGLQDTVQPLVVSHLHFLTLHDRFFMQATRDYTSYCMAPTAIDFFNKLGGLPAISAYNSSLVSWAADMLCQRLHLQKLPIPPELKSPFLSLVSLPDCLGPATVEREKELRDKLLLRHNVVTNICVVDGKLWCRICAQVYNVKEDYTRLAEVLEQEIMEAQMQVTS